MRLLVPLLAALLAACGQPRPNVAPVTDAAWAEACGKCHFAYQPGLLPAASWAKILGAPDDHFGDTLALDAKSLAALSAYAAGAAADRSPERLSARITRDLKGAAPARITEIPVFRKKHKGIGADVLRRKSVGSLAACAACHRSAARGVYTERDVAIPET
jgi:hypothetical protein